MNPETTQNLVSNLSKVQQRIEGATTSNNRQQAPQLLAVSKKHSAEKIITLFEHGQLAFGESYVQEALRKIEALRHLNIIWHFIGPIQSNKTKAIAENFDWVQSVDRMKILTRLDSQRPATLAPLNVLLQYKVGDEDSKSGASKEAIYHMLEALKSMPHLQCRGLMSIPPPSDDVAVQCGYFAEVAELYEQLKGQFPKFDTLSMGMSGDLESATKMGSTMVRIGTDLFGSRE